MHDLKTAKGSEIEREIQSVSERDCERDSESESE